MAGIIIVVAVTLQSVLSPGAAHAHVPAAASPVADWHWRPDVLLVVGLAGTVYLRGWLKLRLRAAAAAPGWRLALYMAALGGVCMALISPIDALASSRLSMHMAQHLLLLMIAPLFFLLADPLAAFLWGIPGWGRKKAGRLLARSSSFRRALRALTLLPVAWSVYVLNLWGWHHPYLYQMALANGWVHDLQHLLFFATAVVFWWPVANPSPRLHGMISYGLRIVYLVGATLQNTVLGMAIALPERVVYPFYETVPYLRGLRPINDQALGGGIMWVSGHMYLIPIVVLVARMLTREEESLRGARPERALDNVEG